MKCPECDSKSTKVTDSRYIEGGKYRRRVCVCGNKWSTYEMAIEKEDYERLMRSGPYRKRKEWTKEEDNELQLLIDDGLMWKEIGQEMGRSYESVKKRAERLELKRKKNLQALEKLIENKDVLKLLKAID